MLYLHKLIRNIQNFMIGERLQFFRIVEKELNYQRNNVYMWKVMLIIVSYLFCFFIIFRWFFIQHAKIKFTYNINNFHISEN